MRVTSLEPEGIAHDAKPGKTRQNVAKPTERSGAQARVSAPTGGNSGSRSTIAIGKKVRITGGLAAGKEAVVHELWPRTFGGVRQWVVVSNDLVRRRVIREDYLEVLP